MLGFLPDLRFDISQCIFKCLRYPGHGGMPQSPMVPPECTPSPLFDRIWKFQTIQRIMYRFTIAILRQVHTLHMYISVKEKQGSQGTSRARRAAYCISIKSAFNSTEYSEDNVQASKGHSTSCTYSTYIWYHKREAEKPEEG